MGPSLLTILRKTLTEVEHSIISDAEEPAVDELRKRLALSIGELELVKAERRSIAHRLFLVRPRNFGIIRSTANYAPQGPSRSFDTDPGPEDDNPPKCCA